MKIEKWLGLGILIIAIAVIAYFIRQSSNNNPTQSPAPVAVTNNTIQQPTSFPRQPVATTGSNNESQQVVNLALGKQCSSDAQGFFHSWETDPSLSNSWAQAIINSGGQPSYASHYNTSLNKCLTEVNGLEYKHNSTAGYYAITYLYDVYGRNVIAFISADSESSFFTCDFPSHMYGDNPDYCTTQTIFDNAVNSYMTQ
jgi:hypothetical protein